MRALPRRDRRRSPGVAVPARSTTTSRVVAVVAIAAWASSVAGCAIVPSSLLARVPERGPIVQGEQVDLTAESQFIRVIARGPQSGMSPVEVVRGFLDASASFDGDHAVAREYLTMQANEDWDTSDGVAIYDGVPELTSSGQAVSLAASTTGRISPIGTFSVAEPGTSLSLGFWLTMVNGEWRISRLPQGLVLSSSDVDRAFRALNVYFFDPTFASLVPDGRMIPVIGTGQPTTLLRYLIDGPSPWLEPAVRTGLPPAVRLSPESVPVDAGVARVNLSPASALADDATRRAISQQVTWLLRQVPGVSSVAITADGQPMLVSGATYPEPIDGWPRVDPNALPIGSEAYAARGSSVIRVTRRGDRPLGVDVRTPGAGLVDLAVSLDSTKVAGLDAEGTLWRGSLSAGMELQQVESVMATSVAFYRSSGLWAVQDGAVVSVEDDGSVTPIAVDGLDEGAVVLSAVPSRDGARCALIVQDGPATRLLLARIVRPNPQGPASLSSPIAVETRLTQVVTVAWGSSVDLEVLGTDGPGELSAFTVDVVRGSVRRQGGPVAPIAIAAAPGEPTLVAAADGMIYELRGIWQRRSAGTAPTYPN